jgi:hypothetical protein
MPRALTVLRLSAAALVALASVASLSGAAGQRVTADQCAKDPSATISVDGVLGGALQDGELFLCPSTLSATFQGIAPQDTSDFLPVSAAQRSAAQRARRARGSAHCSECSSTCSRRMPACTCVVWCCAVLCAVHRQRVVLDLPDRRQQLRDERLAPPASASRACRWLCRWSAAATSSS